MTANKVVISVNLTSFDPTQAIFGAQMRDITNRIPITVNRPAASGEAGVKVELNEQGTGAVSFNGVADQLRAQGFYLVNADRIGHITNFEFLPNAVESTELILIFKELTEKSGWTAVQYNNLNGSVVIVASNVINQAEKTLRKRGKNPDYKAPQAKIVVKKQITMFVADSKEADTFFGYRRVHPEGGEPEIEKVITSPVAVLESKANGFDLSSVIVLEGGTRIPLANTNVTIPPWLRVMDFEVQIEKLIAAREIPADTQFWIVQV